ncbi:MAG: GNAT family N-acetyltransferase [Terracidiphilus sp.]
MHSPWHFKLVLIQTLAAGRRFTAASDFKCIVNSGMRTDEARARNIQFEEIAATASATTRAQAQELLLEYDRFVIAQPGAARFCFGALEKEAERLPQSYAEQGGGCLMALVDGTPAGFVAWRILPGAATADFWELKRLWVRPMARGLGLGRALTQAVIDRAHDAGCTAVYLDTAPAAMAAAHRMYLELGFTPCAAYNDNPVEGIVHLVKEL